MFKREAIINLISIVAILIIGVIIAVFVPLMVKSPPEETRPVQSVITEKPVIYNWFERKPEISPEPRRNGHAIAYDSDRKKTVLFAGRISDQLVYLNDTWEWDGTDWKKIETKTKPPERYYFTMVYDAHRKKVVLFGGNNTTDKKLNDTWEYDGTDWTEMKPETSPPGRFCHAMTYDSARNVTVLFGGWTDKCDRSNDLWEWDGTKWKERQSEHNPPLRNYHALAYDSNRKVTVLYGGYSGKQQEDKDHAFENDTWEWDGTDWTQKSPKGTPSARFTHALVYHPVLKKTILFAGVDTGYKKGVWLNDIWTWDGTNWEKLSPANSPPPRNHLYICYDSIRNMIIVFGGWSQQGGLMDTWEYGANDK